MTRIARCVVALVLLAGCSPDEPAAPAASGAPASPALETLEAGTLTACIAPGPATAEQTDAGLEGYDVAVLREVAAELQLDLEVVTTSFDEVVSGVALNGGRCDVAAAAVVDGPALDAVVTPSAPYRTVDRLVVATGTGGSVEPAELTGTVGVEEGSAATDVLAQLTAAEVVTYPSRIDLGRALEQGVVAAALVTVADRAALQEQLGAPLAVAAVVPTEDETVLLLPLDGDEELLAAVDAALDTLRADGRLGELGATWLGA